jgi:hypothetical protein
MTFLWESRATAIHKVVVWRLAMVVPHLAEVNDESTGAVCIPVRPLLGSFT